MVHSIPCQLCFSNSLIVSLHIGFWHPYRNIFALVDELGISPFTGWNKAAYYSTEGLAVISLLYFCALTCFCSPVHVRCCNGLSNEYTFSISFWWIYYYLKMGLARNFLVCSKYHIVLHGGYCVST